MPALQGVASPIDQLDCEAPVKGIPVPPQSADQICKGLILQGVAGPQPGP
jgi:hypothetical protein